MSIKQRQQSWLRIALLNFIFAAVLGALLRFAFVEEVSWMKYKNFLHAHSHVAMLGWVYLGLYTLFIHTFLEKRDQQNRYYRILFWLTQGSVVGMLISFPIQGYAAFSIFFSTLHVLLSYLFCHRFYKDLKKGSHTSQPAILLAKTALGLMILSTLSLWAMGPIMVAGLQRSVIYYMAVQFFLHFQFNGWFLFAILALFFKLIENQGWAIPKTLFQRFYVLLLFSCFMTYALAVAWSKPLMLVFWANSIGVLVQLGAVLLLFLLLYQIRDKIKILFTSWPLFLLQSAFYFYLLKVIIQTIVVIPYMATIAYTIRNYVIGFIHLLLLGIISFFLFGFASYQRLLHLSGRRAKVGMLIFFIGFLFVESILFLQGSLFWGAKGFLPAYYELLFGATCLMPIGLVIYLSGQIFKKPS